VGGWGWGGAEWGVVVKWERSRVRGGGKSEGGEVGGRKTVVSEGCERGSVRGRSEGMGGRVG